MEGSGYGCEMRDLLVGAAIGCDAEVQFVIDSFYYAQARGIKGPRRSRWHQVRIHAAARGGSEESGAIIRRRKLLHSTKVTKRRE